MVKSYTISEIAKIFNITTNKIRFYEKKGLMLPIREKDNEYRKFNEQDIIRLQSILLYRSIGLTIRDIKSILDNNEKENYLTHFNNQWELVNNEIHRLNVIRRSLEDVIDKLYEETTEYKMDSMFYDSRKAVELHILEKHGSILEYLLGMNLGFIGISQIQRELLVLMASGLTDKEIAKRQGVAQSTVRNHRYKLREKEKQARLFLAMMELIVSDTKKKVNILDKDILCDAHKTATTLDDRYNITHKERESIVKNYLDETGAIKTFPSKEKKKLIVLSEIV